MSINKDEALKHTEYTYKWSAKHGSYLPVGMKVTIDEIVSKLEPVPEEEAPTTEKSSSLGPSTLSGPVTKSEE